MSSETATMTAATLTAPAVDPDKLMAFVFRAVEEAGAALNCALVVMGDRLGYYRSLAEHGAQHTCRARRTDRHRSALHAGVVQRAGRRRLSWRYDPATQRFTFCRRSTPLP